jgi:sulfate adenylyltransferase subunit 2
MRFRPGDRIAIRKVRFRTLGCWPVTGAIESEAADLRSVLDETFRASSSERQGRISDGEDGGSLEQKKRDGYF